ncbi:peptidase M24, structural domain-containing protein [Pseudoneurospora amorphoporcata]|uniref:Xaa-Pro aminopeptidase n=1 Tax=Pseudoneurospora amorphoporcata TaxID=241081 RepID=A0AAN6NJ54_9PEZI|nr:peptidase M24, structural domain-containing protein [Pseudoneurospora amorphoporcata]
MANTDQGHEIHYDLIEDDEFDIVNIVVEGLDETLGASASPRSAGLEVKPPSSSQPRIPGRQLSQKWLHEKLGKYPAKTHVQKVVEELDAPKSGIIYLRGFDEPLYPYSDQGPPFRQQRHFFYLSGADFPGCSVTYDISRQDLILWIRRNDPRLSLWYGTTPSVEETKSKSDVCDVRYVDDLTKYLHANLTPDTTLFVLHPDQTPKLEPPSSLNLRHRFRGPKIDSTSLLPAIEAARVIKTPHEISLIRRAVSLTSHAHKMVLQRIKHLSNEREAHAVFEGFCISQGAPHQSYAVIAASGPNASTLHYDANDQPLEGRQTMLLDAGCEWGCYASDVTRTFPLNGKWTKEGEEINKVVERMQRECIDAIRPGRLYYKLHLVACLIAVEELMKLGILHGGTRTEILAKGTVAAFFPHGLGHHVGLEVHDVSGRERLLLSSGLHSQGVTGISGSRRRMKREQVTPEDLAAMYREAMMDTDEVEQKAVVPPPYKGRQRLRENMVVTIEPGIYFHRPYIQSFFLSNPAHAQYINTKVLDKYWDVGGVRIEDCILVTKDGYENLTTAPKGKEALKIINAGVPGFGGGQPGGN